MVAGLRFLVAVVAALTVLGAGAEQLEAAPRPQPALHLYNRVDAVPWIEPADAAILRGLRQEAKS